MGDKSRWVAGLEPWWLRVNYLGIISSAIAIGASGPIGIGLQAMLQAVMRV